MGGRGVLIGRCCSGLFSRRLEKVRSWRGGAVGEWRKWRAGPTMQACVLSAASTPLPAIPTAVFAQGFFRRMKAGRKLPANRFKEKSISHAERFCTVFPYGVYPKKATSLMVVLEGGSVLCSRIIHFVTYQLLTVYYQLVSGPTLGAA